jgi:hypothetical protein
MRVFFERTQGERRQAGANTDSGHPQEPKAKDGTWHNQGSSLVIFKDTQVAREELAQSFWYQA